MSFVDPDHIPNTGNAAIDAHHRRIAVQVNDLFDAWKAGGAPTALNSRLDEVLLEISDHFAAERSLVRGAGYAEWDTHEPIHDTMRERMGSIRAAVAQASSHTDGMIDAFRFFEDLIFKHEFFDDQDFWDAFAHLPRRGGEDLISFGPEHRIGRTAIDAEHEELVRLLNGIHSALADGEPEPLLCIRVQALRNAAITHFTHEEDTMRSMGHPDLKEHTVLHRVMLRDLEDAIHLCREGRRDDMKDLVSTGIRYWLLDHIAVWDRRI
ncbi:MAG: hemerythrin domain-containing protein [Magnetospirillum sp. WYHS-4]